MSTLIFPLKKCWSSQTLSFASNHAEDLSVLPGTTPQLGKQNFIHNTSCSHTAFSDCLALMYDNKYTIFSATAACNFTNAFVRRVSKGRLRLYRGISCFSVLPHFSPAFLFLRGFFFILQPEQFLPPSWLPGHLNRLVLCICAFCVKESQWI